MSTHSDELEVAQQQEPQADPRLHEPDPDDTDLLFDVQAALVRGFYTPYHPIL